MGMRMFTSRANRTKVWPRVNTLTLSASAKSSSMCGVRSRRHTV